MLKRFGFRAKLLYLCRKNRIFTSEIDFSTLLRIFSLEFADFFRNVGCIFANEERLKLKRYLFSKPHFLLFEEGRGELRQHVLNIYSCNNAYADVFQNSYDEISLNYIFP